jgi:hypothetical protein
MLDHLRQKAAQTLASASSVTLSSYGPADIQSSRVACSTQDLTLYVFLPLSSDHLLNLEQRPGMAAAADEWELQGNARVLGLEEIPPGIKPPVGGNGLNQPSFDPFSTWGWVVIEIRPTRLTLHAPTGLGNIETIDFEI